MKKTTPKERLGPPPGEIVRFTCTNLDCRFAERHDAVAQATGVRCPKCERWHVFKGGAYVAAPEPTK